MLFCVTCLSGPGWFSHLLRKSKRNNDRQQDAVGATALTQSSQGVVQDESFAKKILLKLVGSYRPSGVSRSPAMAAPQHSPQHVGSTGDKGREGYGMRQLLNFMARGSATDILQEDTNYMSTVSDFSSLSKDFGRRIQPVDRDQPPKLSEPEPVPLLHRNTPPQLSPVTDVGLQAAHYDEPRSGTEPEVSSSSASPSGQSEEPPCWKYELLPSSETSPTAIRAKLTRRDYCSQYEDDFSSEEDHFSEDAEDELHQQDDH